MIYSNYILLIIIGVFLLQFSNGDEKLETSCNINGDRALQYVSEKFLSISIDPAVLIAGLNLSDSSLLLAQHLSPAYIRIAGPSTKFVQYKDNEDKFTDRLSEDGNNVVVTPSMWFGINEWLRLANLTPVFGINDIETTREVWNPKSTLPLLEISDKLNISCYWQLGFDSSRKSETQYKQDLSVFYHLLTAFPERNETWRIIGSDISTLPKEHTENTMEELKDIVTAVMWEPREVTEESFPEKDMGWKILHQQHKPNVKLWTSIPKSSEPISFSSALLWAMQVGEAAKFGYEVVFRQPRLHEIFSDTPAYWFSLLHKKLMGSNVLDVKTPIYYPGSAIYAHCTRKQNDYAGKGALTVMIVNNNLQKYKTKVKLGTTPVEKSMEVLSYILTSSAENSTDIYLNGKKLTIDFLTEGHIFEPKQRKTKSKSYISLEVPPMSIGFFVIPEAEVPICVNKESELSNRSQEMLGQHDVSFSGESVLNLSSRGTFIQNPTLQEIAQKMKKEMQSDEKFYNTNSELEELQKKTDSIEDTTKAAGRKSTMVKAKLAAKQRKHVDLEKRKEEIRKFISERAKTVDIYKPDTRMDIKSRNLELTSVEVKKILKDRAKARAAQRDIMFTDEELDALLQKSSKQFLKSKFKRPVASDSSRSKRAINMEVLDRQIDFDSSEEESEYFREINKQYSQNMNKRPERSPRDINMKLLDFRTKLEDNRQRLEDKKYEILGNTQTIKENIKDRIRNLKHKNRYKRDINMDLLKRKTEGQKKALQRDEGKKPKRLFKHKVDQEATIRKPGQTSTELLEELEDDEDTSIEEVLPKVEVYAELAIPEEKMEDDIDFFNMNTKPQKGSIFDRKPIVNPTSYTFKKKKKEKIGVSENLQFLTTSEEFTDIEDDLPCIHEFFGSDFKDSGDMKNQKIVHELGETRMTERKYKKAKNDNRKMTELADMSHEKDPFDELRMKRDTQYIKSLSSGLADANKEVNEQLGENVDYMLSDPKTVKSKDTSNGISKDVVRVDESKLFQFGIEEINFDESEKNQHISENGSALKETESIETKGEKKMNKIADWPLLNEDKAKTYSSKTYLYPSNDEQLGKHNQESNKKLNYQSNDDFSETESLMVTDFSNSRKKRNAEKITEGDDKKGIHVDMKQLMENDKWKIEQRKIKNKEKLANFKRKKENDSIAKQKVHVVGNIQQIENKKRSELLGQLQSLRTILNERKNQLDKSIVEENLGKVKEKHGLTQTQKNPNNDLPKEYLKPKDEKKHDSIENTPTSLTRRLRKRGVFEKYPSGFGSYKPLTQKLKSWRPSDILSLKRDVSLLNSRNLRPTNDYQLYTNTFDQNRYSTFQKRSIDNNFNDLDNYIDKDDNNIEKDGVYGKLPKFSLGNSNGGSVSGIDLNKSGGETEQLINKNDESTVEVLGKENKEEAGSTVDPIIYYTFSGDFGTETQTEFDAVTESIVASTEDAGTVDVDEHGQRMFTHFIRNASKFFKDIGSKFEHYVRRIAIF